MAEPFLGEIRLYSFAFAPRGWAQCNGQLLPISQNTALFSLLGTFYGGNGQTTFALPDIRNRVTVGKGTLSGGGPVFDLGEAGGEANHTLIQSEIPAHIHSVSASSGTATAQDPAGGYFAVGVGAEGDAKIYAATGPDSSAMVLAMAGGSQAHDNTQPVLVMNYCMALQGIFPSQS